MSHIQSWTGTHDEESEFEQRSTLEILTICIMFGWGVLAAIKAFKAGARRAGWWCVVRSVLSPIGSLVSLA